MKNTLVVLSLVAAFGAFLLPMSTLALIPCDFCEHDSPPGTRCAGVCPGVPVSTTCGVWIANNCPIFGFSLSAKEQLLFTLEAQAAQDPSSEALPAEPMF